LSTHRGNWSRITNDIIDAIGGYGTGYYLLFCRYVTQMYKKACQIRWHLSELAQLVSVDAARVVLERTIDQDDFVNNIPVDNVGTGMLDLLHRYSLQGKSSWSPFVNGVILE